MSKLKTSLKDFISRFASVLLDLIYPRRCPACDEIVTPFGEKIHAACIRKLALQKPPWCLKCGKHIIGDDSSTICEDCKKGKHQFIRGRSLYNYKDISASIYRFKYYGRQEYAEYYAEQIVEYLGDFIKRVNPDALIPVPIHRKRFLKRGYNQAAVLSKQISKLSKIPTLDGFVKRTKNTRPLKLLDASERQKNLQKAFIVPRNDVKLKTTIIIDDIYTTGATIDEVARALKGAGVEDVYFVTLASGQGL